MDAPIQEHLTVLQTMAVAFLLLQTGPLNVDEAKQTTATVDIDEWIRCTEDAADLGQLVDYRPANDGEDIEIFLTDAGRTYLERQNPDKR